MPDVAYIANQIIHIYFQINTEICLKELFAKTQHCNIKIVFFNLIAYGST